MCFLRQILNEAADRFDFTPAFRGIKALKQPRSDVHPFTLEEVQQMIETIREDYRDYLTVRFFTGLRTGEINGLKWKHLDLDNNLILVREAAGATTGDGDLKTMSSWRDITMLPMVREAIEHRMASRVPGCPWVFASREGNPIDAHNFCNRIWYPLLRHLGLDLRRPYQTRHTAATLMLASGEAPEWIAQTLGHSTTAMLFKVYSRFVPNLTRQDGRAFAGLVHSRIGAKAGAKPAEPDTPKPHPQPPVIDRAAMLQALAGLSPADLSALMAHAREAKPGEV
jgi:integrase